MEIEATLSNVVLMDDDGTVLQSPSGGSLDVGSEELIEAFVLGEVLTAAAPPTALAFTGSSIVRFVSLAMLLVTLGAGILLWRRRDQGVVWSS